MATKKTAPKSSSHHVPHVDQSYAHAFIAAALGLLLFIVAAQFILSRVIWEELQESDDIAEAEPVAEVAEVASPVQITTPDFFVELPAGFYFIEGGDSTYSIGNKHEHVQIYKEGSMTPEEAATAGGVVLNVRSTDRIELRTGEVFNLTYWYGNPLGDQLAFEALKSTIESSLIFHGSLPPQ